MLAELAEQVDGDALVAEARRAPTAWVQRLGHLLTRVDADALAIRLEEVLRTRKLFTVALAPWLAMDATPRDQRWQVAINTDVDPDQ